MYPDFRPVRQRGSMLIIAIVLIVVIGLLAVALTRLLGSSSESVSYEVLGARALAAANSGMERQLYLLLRPLTGSVAGSCLATDSLSWSEAGLYHCQASLSCRQQVLQAAPGGKQLYRLTSIGRCDNGTLAVSRSVESQVVW